MARVRLAVRQRRVRAARQLDRVVVLDPDFTPSVADDILEGVTRRQVIELIRDELSEPLLERSIDRSELYVCDEALLCGTAVQVVPVIEVDQRPVGDGRAGERTRVLMKKLAAVARGDDARYSHWTTSVYGTKR